MNPYPFLRPLLILRRLSGLFFMAGILLAGSAKAGSGFHLYVANYLAYQDSPYTRFFTIEVFDSLGNANAFATNVSFSNPILSSPEAVALDASGNVYVDCTEDGTWIEKFGPWGTRATQFVTSTVSYPAAMVFDASGKLWVAAGNGIEVYNPQGVGAQFASVNGTAEGLAFDTMGNLFVSDQYHGLILKFDPHTNMTTVASPGNSPNALVFDSSSNLLVALGGNGQIVKYAPPFYTNETLVASLGSSTEPVGLAYDPDGNLYVSEYSANRIVRIDPQTNVTVFATVGLNGPLFMALLPEPYSVNRFVVADGGGASSNGVWTLSGTAGQSDTGVMAGQFMSGELVGVEGGFWAGPVESLLEPSTNLLVNGSFDFGAFVNQKGGDNAMLLYPGATNMLGWTVTGTAGYDLGWMGPGDDLGLSAPNGGYFLDLTGYHDSIPYDGVSQTVATTPGALYNVSFEIGYAARYDSSLPAISVAVTGQRTFTNTFAVSGTNTWETFRFSFIAAASNTTLTLMGASPQNVEYIGLANLIMWESPALPVIEMGSPDVAGGQVNLPFNLVSGSAATFELLQASDVAGPWSTNTAASLTTLTPKGSFLFTLPTNGAAQFYRVQTP